MTSAGGQARSRSLPRGPLLVAGACALVLLLSFLLPPGGVPTWLPGLDTCGFHAATGLPCPGCGLTRAFIALAHGQLREAWRLHPFAFPLYAVCVGGLGTPWVATYLPALTGPGAARILQRAALVLALALMAFGTWRLLHAFTHPTATWSQS